MCRYDIHYVKDNDIKKIYDIWTSTMLINHFWNSTSSPLSFHDQIEGSIVPPLAHQHRTLHALRRAKVAGWMALGKVGFEGWQPWHPSGHPVTPKEIEQFTTAFVNKRFCLEVVRWMKETLKMWLENWEVSFLGNSSVYERCENRN